MAARSLPQLDELPGFSCWMQVVKAYDRCQQLLGRELAKEGLSVAQHEVLLMIRRDEGLAQQTLARRLFAAKSNITGHLARLEEAGWVRRAPDAHDGRSRRVFLTPKGRRLLTRSLERHAHVVRLMTEALSTQEKEALEHMMRRVRSALETELQAAD